MLLKNLTKISPKKIANLKIKGLAINSKKVKKGFSYNSGVNKVFLSKTDLRQLIKINIDKNFTPF